MLDIKIYMHGEVPDILERRDEVTGNVVNRNYWAVNSRSIESDSREEVANAIREMATWLQQFADNFDARIQPTEDLP